MNIVSKFYYECIPKVNAFLKKQKALNIANAASGKCMRRQARNKADKM